MHKGVGCHRVALSDLIRGNELRVSINRAERPNVAPRRIVFGLKVFLLLLDESPKLVNLNVPAIKAAHLLIHDAGATLTDADAQTHDCVAVNIGHTLNLPDSHSFG